MNKEHVKALNFIQEGNRLVDISRDTGLSINVVKNLSRLNKMYEDLQDIGLDDVYINLFRSMDFKALELADVVRSKDIDFIIEVLGSVSNAKKKDIKNIIKSIKEKGNQVNLLKSEIKSKKDTQDDIQERLQIAQEELKNNSDELEYKLFSELSSKEREFFQAHVKKKDNKYILVKKLVRDFQKDLEQEGILKQGGYLWYIQDIETFVSICKKKIENKEELMWKDWSQFDSYGRYSLTYRITLYRDDDTYKIDSKLDKLDIFNRLDEIKQLKNELTEARREVKDIKSKEAGSYKQNTQIVNAVAINEIEGHRLIQDIMCKYYYVKGNIAVPEVSKDEFRFDCFTYNFNKDIEIVEVKNSRSDFIGDKKYLKYKNYCNKLYFALNSEIVLKESEIENLKNEGVGLYKVDLVSNHIETVLEAKEMPLNDVLKKELINEAEKMLIVKSRNGY